MEQESEQMSVSSLGTKCREPGSRKDPVVAVGHVHVETKCGVFFNDFSQSETNLGKLADYSYAPQQYGAY